MPFCIAPSGWAFDVPRPSLYDRALWRDQLVEQRIVAAKASVQFPVVATIAHVDRTHQIDVFRHASGSSVGILGGRVANDSNFQCYWLVLGVSAEPHPVFARRGGFDFFSLRNDCWLSKRWLTR